MYYERIIDQYLSEWAARSTHKPVLLRGARQVGKSTAVRHLGEQFKYFVEINLEKQQDYQATRPVLLAAPGKECHRQGGLCPAP